MIVHDDGEGDDVGRDNIEFDLVKNFLADVILKQRLSNFESRSVVHIFQTMWR
jgi:hypothetical protein